MIHNNPRGCSPRSVGHSENTNCGLFSEGHVVEATQVCLKLMMVLDLRFRTLRYFTANVTWRHRIHVAVKSNVCGVMRERNGKLCVGVRQHPRRGAPPSVAHCENTFYVPFSKMHIVEATPDSFSVFRNAAPHVVGIWEV